MCFRDFAVSQGFRKYDGKSMRTRLSRLPVSNLPFSISLNAVGTKIKADPEECFLKSISDFLGPAFGRTDFSRIFIFGPPDFFVDFLAGFFLLIFVGKSAQKNLQENPRENPPKFIQQKSCNTFLQIGRGKIFFRFL